MTQTRIVGYLKSGISHTMTLPSTEPLRPDAGLAETALTPISVAERETGVSKELLRMWERRYGFPQPVRDAQGDRLYTRDQLDRLCLLRELVDLGHRPGKLMPLDNDALQELLSRGKPGNTQNHGQLAKELLPVLQTSDLRKIRDYVAHKMMQLGLQRFITDFLQHAQVIVGERWRAGQLDIHEEHLFTEQVQQVIRVAISNLLPPSEPPRILLTTPPGETHMMGLLMVEALLRLADVDANQFGTEMRVSDITVACSQRQTDIVAVSISAAFPSGRAASYLADLRQALPDHVEIWCGGRGVQSLPDAPGLRLVHDLESLEVAAADWRNRH